MGDVKGREWYQADEVAEAYEEKRFSDGGHLVDRRERKAVLDAIAPAAGREVLEIACGTGRFTLMLAERGAKVVGLDVSRAMLGQARRKAKTAGRSIDFLRGDAARLPLPDDAVDTVLAMRFFHLADQPETFLREMARVARRQVVFDTFERYSARSAYNFLLPMGSRLYSRREVRSLVTEAGLSLVDAAHDFVLPYGVYRSLPDGVAGRVRRLDTAVGRSSVGRSLASVSFWTARVNGGSDEGAKTRPPTGEGPTSVATD
jgi:ubiquinone/menaquinone biosynthesis C-methylase UbiE